MSLKARSSHVATFVFDLSEKAPELFMNLEKLKRDGDSLALLRELLHSNDKQELVSMEKKDRRDFEQIADLASELGLHRYDLDDKRPQREMTLSPGLQRAIDAHLEKYLSQKTRSTDGSRDSLSPATVTNGSCVINEGSCEQRESVQQDKAAFGKALWRRSMQLHMEQQAWQTAMSLWHLILKLLLVTLNETSHVARCRRTFSHAHDYHINSISNIRFKATFNLGAITLNPITKKADDKYPLRPIETYLTSSDHLEDIPKDLDMDYWELLEHPPKGTEIAIVRTESKLKWDMDLSMQTDAGFRTVTTKERIEQIERLTRIIRKLGYQLSVIYLIFVDAHKFGLFRLFTDEAVTWGLQVLLSIGGIGYKLKEWYNRSVFRSLLTETREWPGLIFLSFHRREEKGSLEIVFNAMGRAINKTVTIVELIKRRIVDLHQITSIGSTDITDTWEPLEEGLLP
ncbi:DExH-box ATP-dependent RNA helicase DExH5, mitochondrial isoform X1 [Tanacetum coccineum]